MLDVLAETVAKQTIGSAMKFSGEFLRTSLGRVAIVAKSSTYLRYSRIRISCAELLRLRANEHFVLVRNAKRPEQFGPFGGVVRRYAAESADDDLFLKFGFEREISDGEEGRDLRGFLRGGALRAFLVWYEKEGNSEKTCMRRELREEMAECAINLQVPGDLEFKTVRTVHEGPFWDERSNHYQFRHFRILEPDLRPEGSKQFWECFAEVIRSNPSIVLATPQEIHAGRTRSGERIGNHACYLFRNRRTGDEPPAFRKPANGR